MANGTGTATWPGNPADGQSQAVQPPNAAQLRLTSVSGTQATGVVSGSTDTTELPDGPARLDITPQDLLQVTPSLQITQYPLQWTGLCGSSALSLTFAQQKAAGINCGA